MPRDSLSPRYDVDESPPHQYLPLPDDGKPWIRILRLRSSRSREAPLECDLIQVVRGDLRYEALSYVWGDQSDKLPLFVNGTATYAHGSFDSYILSQTTVKITRNLHTALLFLRHKKCVRRLWVDAVCIDQADQDEKQRQIGLMGSIYSQAIKTIVWVGEADKDTWKLFYWLRLVHRFQGSKMGRTSGEFGLHLKARLARMGLAYMSMAEFFNRPWFHRIWTAQELCLGFRVLVVCGDHSIGLIPLVLMDRFFHWTKDLANAREMVKSLRTSPHKSRGRVPTRMEFFKHFTLAEGTNGTMKRVNELGIINSVGDTLATEPKDFVFGTLALAERVGVKFPPLDYHMDIEQIYATATRCWLQHQCQLSCLTFAAIARPSCRVPSWAIDWRYQAQAMGDWRRSIFKAYESDEKSCQSWINATLRSRLQEVLCEDAPSVQDWRKLRLKGILLKQTVTRHVDSLSVFNAERERESHSEKVQVKVDPLVVRNAWSESNTLGEKAGLLANLRRIAGAKPPDEGYECWTKPNGEIILRWLRLVEEAEGNLQYPDMHFYYALIRLVEAIFNHDQGIQDPVILGMVLKQVGMAFREYIQDDQHFPLAYYYSLYGDLCRQKIWGDVVHFHAALLLCIEANDFSLFITSSGQLGACYCGRMENGDVIALLSGSDFPMVLRGTEVEEEYQFVGPAYLEELMDGHAWPRDAEELLDITLV